MMKNDIVSRKKRRVEILMKWVKTNLEVSIEKQKLIAQIGWELERHVETIYQLYVSLDEQTDFEEEDICFKYAQEMSQLIVEDIEIKLENTKMRDLFEVMIEVFEDILPIGSVITIKSEMLPDIENGDAIENVRFIIVDRYLKKKDTENYITYCGVLYPFGSLADKRKIYFTPLAIDQVLFRGYEDDLEEAYVCTIKNQIIEQKMYSVAFSLNEEKVLKGGEEYDKIGNSGSNQK